MCRNLRSIATINIQLQNLAAVQMHLPETLNHLALWGVRKHINQMHCSVPMPLLCTQDRVACQVAPIVQVVDSGQAGVHRAEHHTTGFVGRQIDLHVKDSAE